MAGYPVVSETVSGGYYMNNLISIAKWLMTQGFSRAAAAGIAGTIAGESAGSPESVGSGGQGLIGWTPPTVPTPVTDIVTGNWQQDFDNQLRDLLYYAETNSAEAVARGGVDLATLKSATNPQQAASWWSAFEGPLVPGSDIRSSVVSEIYSALGGSTSYTTAPGTSSSTSSGSTADTTADTTTSIISGLSTSLSAANTLLTDAAEVLNFFFSFFMPGQMFRLAAFIVAAVSGGIIVRLYMSGQSEQKMPVVFGLTGIVLVTGFMAFRPWPQSSSGKSYRPVAYLQDIAEGNIPTGPSTPDDTSEIKAGLGAILTIWAAGKVLNAAGNAAGALGSIWNAIKGIFSDVSEGAVDVSATSGSTTGSTTETVLWQKHPRVPRGKQSAMLSGVLPAVLKARLKA